MDIVVGLLCLAVFVGMLLAWTVSLTHWDGKKHCRPEDCDNCPFPPCSEAEKKEIFAQEAKHNERNSAHHT